VGAQAETAKAIAVAALTTVVGFGSLSMSHYPGLRSVGVAAILGAVSTAILSITMLPVLLELFRGRGASESGGDAA
jgi:predicted RND superfamily exporter protein